MYQRRRTRLLSSVRAMLTYGAKRLATSPGRTDLETGMACLLQRASGRVGDLGMAGVGCAPRQAVPDPVATGCRVGRGHVNQIGFAENRRTGQSRADNSRVRSDGTAPAGVAAAFAERPQTDWVGASGR